MSNQIEVTTIDNEIHLHIHFYDTEKTAQNYKKKMWEKNKMNLIIGGSVALVVIILIIVIVMSGSYYCQAQSKSKSSWTDRG